MKISYLILAHKNPSQIVHFVETLDNANTTFFIHIDKKSSIVDDPVLNKIKNKNNVICLKNRKAVNWGGFSQISAILALLQECLNVNKCDFVSLHSGQDFPLKTQNDILRYLDNNRHSEFLEFFPLPTNHWNGNNGLDRIRYYWFTELLGLEKSQIIVSLQKIISIKRRFYHGWRPYGGSQWWTITRECAQYILLFLKNNPDYIKYFKYTHIPDEMFFHTLILNSPFKEKAINNNLRYIDWESGPQYPRILTIDDYEKLISSEMLFARKFDTTIDNQILQKLSAHLWEKNESHRM